MSLSVAQIEAASAFHESYRRMHGPNKRGVVKATYEAVNDGSYTYAAMRSYFNQDGLSVHGQRMLEQARRSEALDNARRSEREEG